MRSINIDSFDVYLDGEKVLANAKVTRLAYQEPSKTKFKLPARAEGSSPSRLKIAAFATGPGEKRRNSFSRR